MVAGRYFSTQGTVPPGAAPRVAVSGSVTCTSAITSSSAIVRYLCTHELQASGCVHTYVFLCQRALAVRDAHFLSLPA